MKRFLRSIILLATITVCVTDMFPQTRDEYLVQVMKYLRDGKINESLILASKARNEHPDDPFFSFTGNNPDPYIFLKPSPSPDQVRGAPDELMDMADELFDLGNDYTNGGMALYRKVLEQTPVRVRDKYRFARHLYRHPDQYNGGEAERLLESLAPLPEQLANRVEIEKFVELTKRLAAKEALSLAELRDSYPEFAGDAVILRKLAENSLESRACAEAAACLQALSGERHLRPEDLSRLSDAWKCLGDDEKADAAMAESEKLSRNLAAVSSLNAKLRSANRDEAIRGLKLLVSREPGLPDAVRLLAGAYVAEGKSVEASSVYLNYLDVHPGDLVIRERTARLLLDSGDYDQAASLVADYPETETGALTGAAQMIRGNNYAGAERMVRKILPANPLDPLIIYKLGQSLGGQGKISEARKHLKKGLKVYPGDPILEAAEENIEFDYARLLSDRGRTTEAIAVYRRLVRIDPSSSQYLLNLGYEEMTNGEFSRAAGNFRKGLKISPGEDWARSGLAYCLMQEWEFDEAIEQMKIVVSRSDDPDYKFQLGSMYNQIGNTREGWSYIRQAAKQGHQEAAALVKKRYGKN